MEKKEEKEEEKEQKEEEEEGKGEEEEEGQRVRRRQRRKRIRRKRRKNRKRKLKEKKLGSLCRFGKGELQTDTPGTDTQTHKNLHGSDFQKNLAFTAEIMTHTKLFSPKRVSAFPGKKKKKHSSPFTALINKLVQHFFLEDQAR